MSAYVYFGETATEREVFDGERPERLPEIYCFCNGGERDWWNMAALSEDGDFLAGHVCSHQSFGPHDLGLVGNWKHESYRKQYPQGFKLIWVDDPKTNKQVQIAHAKHVAKSTSPRSDGEGE